MSPSVARVSERGLVRVGGRVAARRHRRGIQRYPCVDSDESTVRTPGAKHQIGGGANLRPASLGCFCCLRPRVDLSGDVDDCSAFAGEEEGAFGFSTGAAWACEGCGERCWGLLLGEARGARGCAWVCCWGRGADWTGFAMLRTPGVWDGRTTTGAEGCRACIGRKAGEGKSDGGFCTAIMEDDVGGNYGGGRVGGRLGGAATGGTMENEASSERGKVRICVAPAATSLFIGSSRGQASSSASFRPTRGQIRRSTPLQRSINPLSVVPSLLWFVCPPVTLPTWPARLPAHQPPPAAAATYRTVGLHICVHSAQHRSADLSRGHVGRSYMVNGTSTAQRTEAERRRTASRRDGTRG